MRVIAGEFRGRKLLSPASLTTRPVTDRVKQSVFDVLAPVIENACVYDCFAGTGSMGLESLSRGARLACFFEADRSACVLLKKNIALLKVEDRSQVLTSDVFRLNFEGLEPADIIFLDPPYRFLKERADDLRSLALKFAAKLSGEGIVVFRHDSQDSLELPGLTPYDQRSYGGMSVELLRAAK